MSSWDIGKPEAVEWVRKNVPKDADILDVGACDGKWRNLLPDYPNMDAVEAYKPNASRIEKLYRKIYTRNVYCMEYERHYGLVIFGDVLEHMEVHQAQAVLAYAKEHADRILVGVPFLYEQGALGGNPFEIHVQHDLTAELFAERYPGFSVLVQPSDRYCFYIWTKEMES